jgi:hypothetical protein
MHPPASAYLPPHPPTPPHALHTPRTPSCAPSPKRRPKTLKVTSFPHTRLGCASPATAAMRPHSAGHGLYLHHPVRVHSSRVSLSVYTVYHNVLQPPRLAPRPLPSPPVPPAPAPGTSPRRGGRPPGSLAPGATPPCRRQPAAQQRPVYPGAVRRRCRTVRSCRPGDPGGRPVRGGQGEAGVGGWEHCWRWGVCFERPPERGALNAVQPRPIHLRHIPRPHIR